MTSHTETCKGCEVASVEEGRDVERVTAQNDEIVGILRAVEGRNECGFDCTREGGVGSEDQTPGSYENRD